MELSSLSLAELKDLERRIPKEIKRREVDEKVRVRKEIEALANSRGFSLDDLLAESKADKSSKGGKVAPKYRHPQQSDLEWTGRGRKPKWVEAWLNNGGNIEQLAI